MLYTTGRLVAPVVILTINVAAASGVQAQVVDQEQPVIDYSAGGIALGGYYNQQLAQIFTAGRTGLLATVEFPLNCGNLSEPAAGTITLQVRSVVAGTPTDTVFSTSMFEAAAFPTFWPNDMPYLRRLTLATPLPVTAGESYALVLQFSTLNETYCAVAPGPEGDPYPGGDGWYREDGPWGWSPMGSRFDLPFRTLMQEESRTSVFHKDQWICIDRSSLADHLGHGDTIWMPGCRR